MSRKLVYYGHPVLREKCKPVDEIDDYVRGVVADMLRILKEHNGAGLAAPQVGEAIRLFICQVDSDPVTHEGFFTPPLICINPTLEVLGDEIETSEEGCLSIPRMYEQVTRPYRVRLTATDLDGNEFTVDAFGYRARNFCHENDHLNGVLHIDRLSPHRKKQIAPQLKKLKKKYN